MEIQLSDKFNYRRLLRFVFPSIVMMIFTSVYGVVDGLFISNYVGSTGFAGVNLIMPYVMMLSSLGFMIGTGGSALVGMVLGQGDKEKANRIFSLLVYFAIAVGVVLSVVGQACLVPIAKSFGAEGELLEYCITYGRIAFLTTPAYMLQYLFQSLTVTAEKPRLGLAVTVIAGCTNIVLDFLFVGVFGWGVDGAAWATAFSELLGGGIPLIYFIMPNNSLLRVGKPEKNLRYLIKTCTNGSSEFMTNVSISLVNMVYNYQLMRMISEDGVAAYGVIMYVNFIFIASYVGYSMGSAPIVSFKLGAEDYDELKGLFKKSLTIISVLAVVMLAAGQILAAPLSKIFVGYDESLYEMTKHAFRLYATNYVIAGFNIFSSAFFTALNNGLISALISFLRVLLFQISAVLILPEIIGLNGVWIAMTVAEACSLIVSVICLYRHRNVYHYI